MATYRALMFRVLTAIMFAITVMIKGQAMWRKRSCVCQWYSGLEPFFLIGRWRVAELV